LQTQSLILTRENLRKLGVQKSLIFSEFISCAFCACGVRCLNCSSKISAMNTLYLVMSILKCSDTIQFEVFVLLEKEYSTIGS